MNEPPKRYRSIVIDPKRQIVEVVPTMATLEEIRTLVEAETLDKFKIAEHDTSFDVGWIDDGGLSRGKPVYAFLFSNRKHPYAGRCVLIGIDRKDGNKVDAKFPLDVLRASIVWLGLIKPEVTWDHVGNQHRAIVTYSRVK